MAGSQLLEPSKNEPSENVERNSVEINNMEEGAKRPSRLVVEESLLSGRASRAVFDHAGFLAAFLEAKRRRRQPNGVVKVIFL
jgi:hypothetical protein